MTELSRHQGYMVLALQQARIALNKDEVPVGCVLIHNQTNQLIASSYNQTNITKNSTSHCEYILINYILNQLNYTVDIFNSCTLYVTVEPCIMCSAILQYVNIHTIVFGCKNDRFGGCINSCINIPYSYNIVSDIYSVQAIELLKLFYERGNPNAPEHKRTRPLVDRSIKINDT